MTIPDCKKSDVGRSWRNNYLAPHEDGEKASIAFASCNVADPLGPRRAWSRFCEASGNGVHVDQKLRDTPMKNVVTLSVSSSTKGLS